MTPAKKETRAWYLRWFNTLLGSITTVVVTSIFGMVNSMYSDWKTVKRHDEAQQIINQKVEERFITLEQNKLEKIEFYKYRNDHRLNQ